MKPDDIRATLLGFITLSLGVKLYDGREEFVNWQGDTVRPDWQAMVHCWFDDTTKRTKGTLVTPNGAGKDDRIIGPLAMAYAAIHRNATVVVHTRDGEQLDTQTMPAIEQFRERVSSKWKFQYRYVESPSGSRIIGRAIDDPGRGEGFHKDDNFNGPVLGIVNEAKSIPDGIFEAIDRWTFNGLLYISSPGLMMGRFYESHTSLAPQFRHRMAVGLDQCPHMDPAKIADLIASYGEEHPFVQSSVFGRFTNQDETSKFVFPMHELDDCIAHPPTVNGSERFAFCDFAAGGDENVIAVAEGNSIRIHAAWKEKDTASATGRFMLAFRELGLSAENTWGDETGMGIPICNYMREAGFDIGRENNGSAPLNPRYINRGAEIWHETAAMVRRKEIIVPNDPILRKQLVTRGATIDSRGRLGVEKKEDLAQSPDRADAFCGAAMAQAGKMARGSFAAVLI